LIALLTLPLWIGLPITILVTTLVGLGVYFIGHQVTRTWAENDTSISVRLSQDMFRIGGTLLALILSLTFADLRIEHAALRASLELETTQLLDMNRDLGFLGTQSARNIQRQLLDYTERVVEVEWAQLAEEGLDPETTRLFNAIQSNVHHLEATTAAQLSLRRNLIRDVSDISDHRHHRAIKSTPHLPMFIHVEIAGFLITMMMLTVYSPTRNRLLLMTLYCTFIGIVVYAMLASGSPFHGPMKLSADPFAQAHEMMLAGSTGG
jgi:hypothetical protein